MEGEEGEEMLHRRGERPIITKAEQEMLIVISPGKKTTTARRVVKTRFPPCIFGARARSRMENMTASLLGSFFFHFILHKKGSRGQRSLNDALPFKPDAIGGVKVINFSRRECIREKKIARRAPVA